MSVARIHKVPGRKDLPEVEYPTFMVGDRIQTKKAKFLKKKSKTARLNRKYKKSKSKRGIASIPTQSANSKKYRKKLKKKYNFSDRIREEIARPTNFDDGPKSSGGPTMAAPKYLVE